MKHAEFSPSRLSYLQKCLGWKGGVGGVDADRGTSIDMVLTACITGKATADTIPAEFVEQVSCGLEVFQEAKTLLDDPEVFAQQHLDTGIEGCAGTCDLVLVDEWNQTAILIDWKTGYGDRPPAYLNYQLLAYAIGAVRRWDLKTIDICLVELDRQTVSKASFDRETLLVDIVNRIRQLISDSKKATPVDYKPGDHCKYCAKATECPAVRTLVIEPSALAVPPQADPVAFVESMSMAQLSEFVMRFRDPVKLAAKVIGIGESKLIAALVVDPEALQDWTLEDGRRSRDWKDKVAAEAALVEMTAGIPLPTIGLHETTLLSPVQIEKLFKSLPKLKDKLPAVQDLIRWNRGNPRLVRVEQKEIA